MRMKIVNMNLKMIGWVIVGKNNVIDYKTRITVEKLFNPGQVYVI